MGRKGSWFSSVKKAFRPESKEKRTQKADKSKKKWFAKEKTSVPDSSTSDTLTVSHPLPPPEVVTLTDVENEQTKHAYTVAVATAAAAEAAVAAAEAAAEVVRLTKVTQFTGKPKEDVAAIRIQTAFRGYQARKALRALRGFVRLKLLVEGSTVKRQTANTLKCMQTLSRVQSQIHSRRIRMSEENQALQKLLLQKHVKELGLMIGEEWDDSLQSKEQIEANLLSKYEATMRREKALAYSFSHQQTRKQSSKYANLLFMDPSNPHWGWSWLERWMAARPLVTQSMAEKDHNNDQSSHKTTSLGIIGGEIMKAYTHHQLGLDKPLPPASLKPSHSSRYQSPSTPPSKAASSAAARKLKPASPRTSTMSQDDDSRSTLSMHSERNRRHSIAGSSVRDDESLGSSPAIPSYMVSTQSAKAKSRMQSPLGMENGMLERGSPGSVKKRLSFPSSPARPRRHSGPPKVDTSSFTDHNVKIEGTK